MNADPAHPSKTADPNGLVDDEPPKKRSQTVFANATPSASLWKPYAPPAPPRLKVRSLPETQSGTLISHRSCMQFEQVHLSPGKL